jgi:hypothetical protein
MAESQWTFITNHLFLPPRLPITADQSTENDTKLCEFVLQTAERYNNLQIEPGTEDQTEWAHVVRMLRGFTTLIKTGGYSTHDVSEALSGMLVNGEFTRRLVFI